MGDGPADTDCACGMGRITWRRYAPLPFPEAATPAQKAKRERGGRWVHENPHTGEWSEWCPVRRARPAVPSG